jgi:hypothetical protein
LQVATLNNNPKKKKKKKQTNKQTNKAGEASRPGALKYQG